MKKPDGKTLIKYTSAVVFCAALSWLYLALREFASAPELEQYRMLSDAFLIPGLLMVLFGLLVILSGKGALDGISYALRRAVGMLLPGTGLRNERYFDYVERKREKPLRGYGFLFVVGGGFLLVSIFYYIRFYQLYLPGK
ncbi:hypothetical protein IMSAGC003_00261 [Lachnospiraceae bacterium]|nr:DUF3899 domain-containing protein [Lachnospiraceae bacterium]MCX4271173.1 DUF3899 domain-containing protein [Acetatifactor sp.]GFH93733.1 hypothetical protein IMSAGC003_00261 [Lachnospiraceae bacterium]